MAQGHGRRDGRRAPKVESAPPRGPRSRTLALLNPGDQVAITHGPFADFVAEVEKIDPDRRVWVLMDLMGSQTRVAVGADQLRAI